MSSYTVNYERDESSWWVATVVGVDGCHTQGRTINQARKRIREALSLCVDGAEGATLIDNIILPQPAQELLNQIRESRKRLELETGCLKSSTARAARLLTKDFGVGFRDAGELLGLSHQRIQQLLPSTTPKKQSK